jgi:hypothetical protein
MPRSAWMRESGRCSAVATGPNVNSNNRIVGWAEQREAQRDLITDIVGLHFVQPNLRYYGSQRQQQHRSPKSGI